MTLKQKAHQYYFESITNKITIQLTTLADLNYSAANETKSIAGDKHETALAMLQIEQSHVGKKLEELKFQLLELNQIDKYKANKTIALGSLIKTNEGYFYLSAALGKTVLDNVNIIALSVRSPLGNLLMGKKLGEQVGFNNTIYIIEELF